MVGAFPVWLSGLHPLTVDVFQAENAQVETVKHA